MHNHNNTGSTVVTRHLFLLIVAMVVLAILYIESQSITAVGIGAVLFLLAHGIAAVVILFSGRSLLRRIFRKLHGHPAQPDMDHHHADELETEGRTIGWAWFYDIFIRLLFSGNIQKMIESTVKLANIQSGEKVLDVGCGTGTLAILAKQHAPHNAQIYGRDAAPEMIERAQQKARQKHIDVDFQTGLAEDLQFPTDTFDVVMNSLMMHHLPPELQLRAIAEMYRVLKPGGRLLIVDFEPPKQGLYKSVLKVILGDMTAIDNSIIPPLLQDAGFTDVEMGATDSSVATYISGKKPDKQHH